MSESVKSYKIKKKIAADTFQVPRKLISKLSQAGEAELKIFLIMASLDNDCSITEDELLPELEKAGVAKDDIAEGLAFLRGAGLIEKGSAKRVEKLPEAPKPEPQPKPNAQSKVMHQPSSQKLSYTSKQLAEASKGDFKHLYEWACDRMGKSFNTSDVAVLYSFVDYLCLPQDVIMLAIEHCVSEGKNSLRYVEKLLIHFADEDINTYQKAEDYILKRKSYFSFESKIRKLLGLGERALTAREKTIIESWQEWQMPDELIKLAYEKTVNNTKKASVSYMNKILESWHSLGFKTLADVEKGKPKQDDTSSFIPDDFFKIAIESTNK